MARPFGQAQVPLQYLFTSQALELPVGSATVVNREVVELRREGVLPIPNLPPSEPASNPLADTGSQETQGGRSAAKLRLVPLWGDEILRPEEGVERAYQNLIQAFETALSPLKNSPLTEERIAAALELEQAAIFRAMAFSPYHQLDREPPEWKKAATREWEQVWTVSAQFLQARKDRHQPPQPADPPAPQSNGPRAYMLEPNSPETGGPSVLTGNSFENRILTRLVASAQKAGEESAGGPSRRALITERQLDLVKRMGKWGWVQARLAPDAAQEIIGLRDQLHTPADLARLIYHTNRYNAILRALNAASSLEELADEADIQDRYAIQRISRLHGKRAHTLKVWLDQAWTLGEYRSNTGTASIAYGINRRLEQGRISSVADLLSVPGLTREGLALLVEWLQPSADSQAPSVEAAPAEEQWRTLVPGGRSDQLPWESDLLYKSSLVIPSLRRLAKPTREHLALFNSVLESHDVHRDQFQGGTGLVIGFGDRIDEMELLAKQFRLSKMHGVEWLWDAIATAARYYYQQGYSPERLALHHASFGNLRGIIADRTIHVLYATGIHPVVQEGDAAAEIARVLAPGAVAYLYIAASDDDTASFVGRLSEQGKILYFDGIRCVVFQKSNASGSPSNAGGAIAAHVLPPAAPAPTGEGDKPAGLSPRSSGSSNMNASDLGSGTFLSGIVGTALTLLLITVGCIPKQNAIYKYKTPMRVGPSIQSRATLAKGRPVWAGLIPFDPGAAVGLEDVHASLRDLALLSAQAASANGEARDAALTLLGGAIKQAQWVFRQAAFVARAGSYVSGENLKELKTAIDKALPLLPEPPVARLSHQLRGAA